MDARMPACSQHSRDDPRSLVADWYTCSMPLWSPTEMTPAPFSWSSRIIAPTSHGSVVAGYGRSELSEIFRNTRSPRDSQPKSVADSTTLVKRSYDWSRAAWGVQ